MVPLKKQLSNISCQVARFDSAHKRTSQFNYALCVCALLESLSVTLREALEFNRDDAINAAGEGHEELKIAL